MICQPKLYLALILILAAAFRFYGLDWDGGIGAHPDERHVLGVAESLDWPERLNPFDAAPDFAYGHLPLYLLMLAGKLAPGADMLLLGRALSALFDLGVVALTFALGRQTYADHGCPADGVALLAAAFVALMLLHVQQAHFYTADAPLVFFVLGTLLFGVRLAEHGRTPDVWLMGMWAGMALGTKFSAAMLVLPLGAALMIAPAEAAPGRRWVIHLRRSLACGAAALLAFALTNPYALLEFSTFWRNVSVQSSIIRGMLDVPYTRQFHGTWPYLYPIVQQLRWGMGWSLGLLAFGGLAYTVWQAVREAPRRAEWVLLAWIVPGCGFVGALYARFPRYLLPLTPLLAVYAATLLLALRQHSRRLALLFTCSTLLYSFLHCLAFANLYRTPHPWQLASEWVYGHVSQGTAIAIEQWDHPLPLNATGYDVRELPIFDEDSPEKWQVVEGVLAEVDYVLVASQRGYATLACWPERYPLTAQYYARLFGGGLGFEPVACFGRHPRLGPLALADDPTAGLSFALPDLCQPQALFVVYQGRLDESFVVYEHPQVVIWRRIE